MDRCECVGDCEVGGEGRMKSSECDRGGECGERERRKEMRGDDWEERVCGEEE